MGGLVIETIRPGVQFTPEAVSAFRRAEAEVRQEFGRDIDTNSTYRAWATQLAMYEAWNRYVASGYKPSLYPGHSKAVHPNESFHVDGTALDSDDWRSARIVSILATNGFIRNRLNVPGEQHHFEYLRGYDRNYGKPAATGSTTTPPEQSEEDDMPKNSGFIYRGSTQKTDERTVLICNYGSGIFHEYTNGTASTDSAYNAAIAKAFDTTSFAEISASHAESIKKSLKG